MSYLIGIDIGTSGTKTIMIDEKGRPVASDFQEYPLYTPHPNWAEQETDDWWRATVESLKNVVTKSGVKVGEIKGIGLSGQMHGAVLMDEKKKVLRRSIIWCDQRSAKQCEEMTKKIGAKRLNELTANPSLPGFTAGKVLWVKDNEPELFKKTRTIFLPKDYIRFRLTGEIAMEVSDAAGTLYFDVRKREWSKEVLSSIGIPYEFMPRVYESIDVISGITKEVAKLTGLKEGTPVVGGGADNTCGAVGNGIVKEGIVSASIGSSGVVFAHTDKVKVDPRERVHTFCHSVPNKWYLMGVMQGAGLSYRWFRDNLGKMEIAVGNDSGVDPYELLGKQAEQAPVGSEGLIFLPYLMGERTPHKDSNAKAVFFGITARHGRSHLIRAIMEGVAYGLRDSIEIIKGLGQPIKEVRATGGGGKSKFWRQIQADINNTEMVTINISEGPAFGAAILAGVGTKVYKSIESATDAIIKIADRTEPIAKNVKIYDEFYQVYQALYPALKPQYDRVSEIVAKL